MSIGGGDVDEQIIRDQADKIAALEARLAAAEKVIEAADEMRGMMSDEYVCTDAYDLARREWEGK